VVASTGRQLADRGTQEGQASRERAQAPPLRPRALDLGSGGWASGVTQQAKMQRAGRASRGRGGRGERRGAGAKASEAFAKGEGGAGNESYVLAPDPLDNLPRLRRKLGVPAADEGAEGGAQPGEGGQKSPSGVAVDIAGALRRRGVSESLVALGQGEDRSGKRGEAPCECPGCGFGCQCRCLGGGSSTKWRETTQEQPVTAEVATVYQTLFAEPSLIASLPMLPGPSLPGPNGTQPKDAPTPPPAVLCNGRGFVNADGLCMCAVLFGGPSCEVSPLEP